MVLVQQSRAPWEQRADHVFEADRPTGAHGNVVPSMLGQYGAGPARDVRIHRAETVRCSLAPCVDLIMKFRTFHFAFDHAHVEFELVSAYTATATLHIIKVNKQFAEHAGDR